MRVDVKGYFRIAAICAALGVSCGPADPPPLKTTGARQGDSNGGNYTVSFKPSPDPIPMNQLFDLVVTATPKAAGSGNAPAIEVDARMPAHGHGMNRVPKVARQGDGSFKAEGLLFHMPGHWELYFDISQGGKSERAQFDVDLK
jgi:hypothetical protein